MLNGSDGISVFGDGDAMARNTPNRAMNAKEKPTVRQAAESTKCVLGSRMRDMNSHRVYRLRNGKVNESEPDSELNSYKWWMMQHFGACVIA